MMGTQYPSEEYEAYKVERKMSLGQDRVRVSFNPSGDGLVNGIKTETAKLIDACEELRSNSGDPEIARCCALAMTAYEEAAMWAVKAATAKK